MAYTGKYTSEQIDAILDAITGGSKGYYTSQYSGEELDQAVTDVADLKTRVAALEDNT